MLYQGYFLLSLLTFKASLEEFFVTNATSVLRNHTCVRDDVEFYPCFTLVELASGHMTHNNYQIIYLLDNYLTVGENIAFYFINLAVVKIRPWRNGTLGTIQCVGEVSFAYTDVRLIVMESLKLYHCGKSIPVVTINGTKGTFQEVIIANMIFMGSRLSTINISCMSIKLLIVNSQFNETIDEYAIIIDKPQVMHSNFTGIIFSSNEVGAIFYSISNKSSLNIIHCIFVNNTSHNNHSYGALAVNSLLSITIVNCNFHNNSPRGAIQIHNEDNITVLSLPYTLTINESNFVNNTAMRGGALGIEWFFNLIIFNSNFINNQAYTYGGSIKILERSDLLKKLLFSESFFLLTNCTFHKNNANSGGAIEIEFIRTENYSYYLKINDTFFSNNWAEKDGGALSIYEGTKLYLYRCTFIKNSANGNATGGSISSFASVVHINKCIFDNNSASSSGGALNIEGATTFIISSSDFTNNIAENGGALKLHGKGSVLFHNTTFTKNRAEQLGGAVTLIIECALVNNFASNGKGSYLFVHGNINISNSNFTDNGATFGGALSVSGCRIHIYYSSFTENTAGSGGALIIHKSITTHFNYCNFHNNRASENDGGAIEIHSNIVYIKSCIFRSNFATSGSGGAVAIIVGKLTVQYSTFDLNEANVGAALEVHSHDSYFLNSKFLGNTADHDGGALSLKSNVTIIQECSYNNNSASQGNGGAISVFSDDILIMYSTNITGNSAKYGGGLKLHDTSITLFLIVMCIFDSNEAENAGGAINIKNRFGKVLISISTFLKNSASKGGALSLRNIVLHMDNTNISSIESASKILNIFKRLPDWNYACSFCDFLRQALLNNKAQATFSNYSKIAIIITNCSFNNNQVKNRESGEGGALAIQGGCKSTATISNFMKNKVAFTGTSITDCTFKKNEADAGGAIHSYLSTILASNLAVLNNSAGYIGGGIALIRSRVYLDGKFNFTHNKVKIKEETGKGGALYIEDTNETCIDNSCPISWTNKTIMNFVNNSATRGLMMYGGMLDRCFDLPGDNVTSALQSVTTLDSLSNFKSPFITSDATQLHYCQDLVPKCESRDMSMSIFPGEEFYIYVACVDQLQQHLSCIVKSEYNKTELQLGRGENSRDIGSNCHKLSFHAYAQDPTFSTLKIWSNILCTESKWNTLAVHVKVKSCPLGFELIGQECQCDKRLQDYFAELKCNIDSKLFSLKDKGWFSYSEHYLRLHINCPLNYCSNKKINISLQNRDIQCKNNRGGILCGGCIGNYSIVLGSWKCRKCTNLSRYNFIWLTVVIALAGVVLVAFLLLVKMTVSSGTINGFIFYANIISFSGLLDYQTCSIHPILRVFLSWINLDFGIEVCFYSGMDVYQKTWLQFVFPFYIWFLVGVIILFCHYSSTVMKLMGMRNIEVLATLFLLSYAKLLKTIVTALSFTDIMVASADNVSDPLISQRVWVYEGNIEYFSIKHIPLFGIALVFLIFLFLPFTLFLTFGHFLQHFPLTKRMKWAHNTYITAILDTYHAPYTKKHRYWTGLGLLLRCCLFTIFGTSYSIQNNLFWIILGIIAILILRVTSGGRVYRKKLIDMLDLFIMFNLIILMVVLYKKIYCKALTISISLSFAAFLGSVIYHIHLETKKKMPIHDHLTSKIGTTKTLELSDVKTSVPADKNDGPSVSYFELRESLIGN